MSPPGAFRTEDEEEGGAGRRAQPRAVERPDQAHGERSVQGAERVDDRDGAYPSQPHRPALPAAEGTLSVGSGPGQAEEDPGDEERVPDQELLEEIGRASCRE